MLRGCFVTGTDTGVGKTVLAAALAAGLRARGVRVAACKPVITGLEEPTPPGWPADHELLARATGRAAREVALFGYGPPVSPHLAAELAARPIDPGELERRIVAVAAGADLIVVEGTGGLLVPLSDGYDIRRLATSLGLPLLIAARPGLGTINHTLLTLESARAAGLRVAAVVLTPWPPSPDRMERSNRATIAALGGVAVEVLPRIACADPSLLEQAARTLPLRRWLSVWRVCRRGAPAGAPASDRSRD
ncbi:MAG: dethiobiotin synthase [Solirubrobacterales bacterium]|nr:dethiobiotin synthase [Solirubrobacterales bacterium]MBV8942780.1 dethiobiotin synthase [Solirubrobacterales bacterium]